MQLMQTRTLDLPITGSSASLYNVQLRHTTSPHYIRMNVKVGNIKINTYFSTMVLSSKRTEISSANVATIPL